MSNTAKLPWKLERNHDGVVFGISGSDMKHDLDLVCAAPHGRDQSSSDFEANAELIVRAVNHFVPPDAERTFGPECTVEQIGEWHALAMLDVLKAGRTSGKRSLRITIEAVAT